MHGGNWVPVPRLSRPALRVSIPRGLVDSLAVLQQLHVLAGVTQGRRDGGDATVAMFFVVPGDESFDPLTRSSEALKGLVRKVGSLAGGAAHS